MQMYTVKEVADKLKLKDTTIRKYISERKLSAYKFGRQYVVSEDDLKEFLKRQRN